ncbi:hypothetical protein KOW79_001224 [Hemibagrus wyckioides]|uniref:Uncharacterized protein n=1 Tax=Hemibagrus wyckioides TaxID=337641 RepID=A0A9D3P4R4_9TELE|nr:hypothetical protein KOW79_001224 [Hemibagrus wyckioides]
MENSEVQQSWEAREKMFASHKAHLHRTTTHRTQQLVESMASGNARSALRLHTHTHTHTHTLHYYGTVVKSTHRDIFKYVYTSTSHSILVILSSRFLLCPSSSPFF